MHTRPQVRRRAEPSPSGRFAANGAWLAVQTMAHNLARWTARIGLGERIATTKTLRRRFFSLAGRLTRSARRLTLHLPDRWPWAEKFSRALARLRAIPLPGLTAPSATDPPTGQPKIPADSCQPGPREFPAAYSLAIPRIAAPADGHRGPCAAMKTVRRPPYPKWNPGYFPCSSLTPPSAFLTPSIGVLRWIRAYTLRRAPAPFIKVGAGVLRAAQGEKTLRSRRRAVPGSMLTVATSEVLAQNLRLSKDLGR